jgi:hypothetical protein
MKLEPRIIAIIDPTLPRDPAFVREVQAARMLGARLHRYACSCEPPHVDEDDEERGGILRQANSRRKTKGIDACAAKRRGRSPAGRDNSSMVLTADMAVSSFRQWMSTMRHRDDPVITTEAGRGSLSKSGLGGYPEGKS